MKSTILTLFVAIALYAQADPTVVKIRIAGEPVPLTLPLNLGLSAWTKIYGTGYHNLISVSGRWVGYCTEWT
ncbi:MAG: hypothetical protein JO170_15815 [Verrucomicrobia bacterium]|nr:hypothetical protein [Verrucomicrobiota bacterium]